MERLERTRRATKKYIFNDPGIYTQLANFHVICKIERPGFAERSVTFYRVEQIFSL